jgi:exonuclease SbcC
VIDFSDFTAIKGPTNSGKSAIIRALIWCLYNRPSGTDFITHGEDTAKVTIIFTDGTEITRCRSTNGENYYEVVRKGKPALHLEGFGVGPVQEVIDSHGMREVNFAGEMQSLNVCGQFAKPFFLAESAPERAVIIGKLANTDVVDLAIKNVASEIREDKATLKKLRSDLVDINNQLKDLKDVPFLERDLEVILSQKLEIDKLVSLVEKVQSIKDNIGKLNEQKKKLQKLISEESFVNCLIKDIDDIVSTNNELKQVNKTNTTINSITTTKNKLDKVLNNINLIEVEGVIQDLDSTVKTLKNLNSVKTSYNKFIDNQNKLVSMETMMKHEQVMNDSIKELETCQKTLIDLNKVKDNYKNLISAIDRKTKGDKVIKGLHADYEVKFKKYKEELAKNPVCPICQNDITKDKIDKIKTII